MARVSNPSHGRPNPRKAKSSRRRLHDLPKSRNPAPVSSDRGTPMSDAAGGQASLQPQKGDFIAPPEVVDTDEARDALPPQEEFWRPPVRFGSVPVEKEPLGWDRRRGFRKLFPPVALPFQVVERVSFGHPTLEPNRLFWGDNLHVMRQLPTESIDLIYIDPPFFSGRQYNVIFGDQNELRSFSDIWEGGMPGYLIWLNARLYEMKRLLKKSGTIFVHCDWHASHYIKTDLDKIFGYDRLLAEIIWHKNSGGIGRTSFSKRHDIILQYSKTDDYYYDGKAVGDLREQEKGTFGGYFGVDEDGREYREVRKGGKVYKYYMDEPRNPEDVWEVAQIPERDKLERIGYPTQKPIELLQRIVNSPCPPGGVVADFFMGGGTTCVVTSGARIHRETVESSKRDGTTNQHVKRILKVDAPPRRWIGCDQSRVAVAVTVDRVMSLIEIWLCTLLLPSQLSGLLAILFVAVFCNQ
jgi:DNA modification methylase